MGSSPARQDVLVVIPAYRPSSRLLDTVEQLRHLFKVVVVDDGSGETFAPIFAKLAQQAGVTVIKNAVNLGKGAALKYGFNHVLSNYPSASGIITADADGQHAVADIIAVAEALAVSSGDELIMGCRTFGKGTPPRSRFGNQVSRVLYRLLLGVNVSDTQTGLRGVPRRLAEQSLKIRSNRYEFESEQLAMLASLSMRPKEVPIETIYEENNASSHFNPLFDSARIYFVVLRYAFASIVTTVVDLVVFATLVPFGLGVIPANLASRGVALFVQFFLLRTFVFHAGGGVVRFLLFVAYVASTGLASGVLQSSLSSWTGAEPLVSKVVVETLIFIFNFLFLKDILFVTRRR